MNNYDPEWDGNQWLENEDDDFDNWFGDEFGDN